MQIIKIIDQLFPNLADELHCSDLDCPLDPIDFISHVLVPEAARMLIKDDLHVSDQEVLNILMASQAFGAALHPDSDTNGP